MRNILIVGRPRAGKTSFAMETARGIGFPLVVNDVNIDRATGRPEWEQRPLTVKEFMDLADRRNGMPTTFVWEEATSYLGNVGVSGRDRERVIKALIRRFHTKHVNILLFHSLRGVPVWVMDFADRLILFKTNDRPSLIQTKFRGWDSVLDAWYRVNINPNPYQPEDIEMTGS